MQKLAAFVLLCGGCASLPPAYRVKLVSLQASAPKGKTLGGVEGRECITRVLGYGPTSLQGSVATAVSRAGEGKSVRYYNDFSLDKTYRNFVFWEKECYVVKGEAFE